MYNCGQKESRKQHYPKSSSTQKRKKEELKVVIEDGDIAQKRIGVLFKW